MTVFSYNSNFYFSSLRILCYIFCTTKKKTLELSCELFFHHLFKTHKLDLSVPLILSALWKPTNFLSHPQLWAEDAIKEY